MQVVWDEYGTTAGTVALHEAAHAVASVLLDVPFTDVSAKLPFDAVICWRHDDKFPTTKAPARVAAALAGGVVHAGALGGRKDYRTFASAADLEFARTHARIVGFRPGRALEAYLDQIADMTATLLSGDGAIKAVVAVAAELMDRERLTFEAVRRIVNRFVEV